MLFDITGSSNCDYQADTSHEQEEAAIEGDRTNRDVNAIVKQTIGLNRYRPFSEILL